MFATLAGGYPATDPGSPPERSVDASIRVILAEQAEAGLGLLTDGSLRWPDPLDALGRALLATDPLRPHQGRPLTVAAWTFAAAAAGGVPVKQCLPGPFSLGRRFAAADRRTELTLAFADVLAAELVDLAAAGCPFVQIDEDAAVTIGADPAERTMFRDAQARLLAGLDDVSPGGRPHLSVGDQRGERRCSWTGHDLRGPVRQLPLRPNCWSRQLAAGDRRTRAERGIVLGVADARSPAVDEREVVVWAVGYAAASRGRGEARVGIAPSGSLAGLPRAAARAKIERLGEIVRLIDRRAEEPIQASLNPRAIDARSAALGRWTPPRKRYPRQVQAQRRRSR